MSEYLYTNYIIVLRYFNIIIKINIMFSIRIFLILNKITLVGCNLKGFEINNFNCKGKF